MENTFYFFGNMIDLTAIQAIVKPVIRSRGNNLNIDCDEYTPFIIIKILFNNQQNLQEFIIQFINGVEITKYTRYSDQRWLLENNGEKWWSDEYYKDYFDLNKGLKYYERIGKRIEELTEAWKQVKNNL